MYKLSLLLFFLKLHFFSQKNPQFCNHWVLTLLDSSISYCWTVELILQSCGEDKIILLPILEPLPNIQVSIWGDLDLLLTTLDYKTIIKCEINLLIKLISEVSVDSIRVIPVTVLPSLIWI